MARKVLCGTRALLVMSLFLVVMISTATVALAGTRQVRVSCSCSWSGSIGDKSGIRSVQGSGTATYNVDGESVSAIFQKASTDGTLKVEILDGGNAVERQITDAAYGLVQVSHDFTNYQTIALFILLFLLFVILIPLLVRAIYLWHQSKNVQREPKGVSKAELAPRASIRRAFPAETKCRVCRRFLLRGEDIAECQHCHLPLHRKCIDLTRTCPRCYAVFPAEDARAERAEEPAATSELANKENIKVRLRRLKELKVEGLVTEQEFLRKREEILREL